MNKNLRTCASPDYISNNLKRLKNNVTWLWILNNTQLNNPLSWQSFLYVFCLKYKSFYMQCPDLSCIWNISKVMKSLFVMMIILVDDKRLLTSRNNSKIVRNFFANLQSLFCDTEVNCPFSLRDVHVWSQ